MRTERDRSRRLALQSNARQRRVISHGAWFSWSFACSGRALRYFERGGRTLQRSLIGLRVDPNGVQPTVSEKRSGSWQIDRLDQTPCSVVAKAVRMNVLHIRPPSERGKHVAHAPVGIRASFAKENGSFGRDRLDCA
jgi:hypothetical protein